MGSRLEEVLRRRAFVGADAYVFGHAKTGGSVSSFRSAWETLLLLSAGVEPSPRARGKRQSDRDVLAKINLRWHDLRDEALSRLADDGVPGHELQMLAGNVNVTTTGGQMGGPPSRFALRWTSFARWSARLACHPKLADGERRMVARDRIELSTLRFSVVCSTN